MEYFPGFNTLQLSEEVKRLLLRLDETPENFAGRILFMSMFNDTSCGSKDNEKECLANAKLVSLYAKRFGKGQWSFIVPGSEKKWYCISEDSPQGVWLKGCCWNSQKVIVQFSTLRVHCPEVDSEAKDTENCRYTMQPILETIETIVRIIVSANQLSLCGAIAEICEEYETFHERTERSVVMGPTSSLVLSVIKTEVPLDCDDPANQDLLLQQYGERIEKLSQQDNLSKLCTDAGFLNVVEIGLQISHNSVQRPVVSTLCQENKKHRNQKDGSKGTPRLGPYWKLQPVTCMVSMELRSEFGP